MSAALRLVHKGYCPLLFSNTLLGQTVSVPDEEGFNAVLSAHRHDSIVAHIEDTLSFGCHVMPRKPVIEMCRLAPDLIQALARMGIVLDHDGESFPIPGHQAGSRFPRTYRAKNSLGRQLAQTLADSVRFLGFQDKIKIHEDWEFLSLVLDESGVCRGIAALNGHSMQVIAFRCDAVILSAGGMEKIFGTHTRQPSAHTGSALAQTFLQGGALAGCEFVEFEENASEESGGETVLGIRRGLGGLLTGDGFASSLAGVHAAGGCAGALHGARSLPGNVLLGSLFSGLRAADAVHDYVVGLERDCLGFKDALFNAAQEREARNLNDHLDLNGPENIHTLSDELAETMREVMGRSRQNAVLTQAVGRIAELRERSQRASVADKGRWVNREVVFAKDLKLMLELAEVMVLSALNRNESRGVHQKPEFSGRDDAGFLKLTVAVKRGGQTQIEFRNFDNATVKHESLSLKNKTA